MQSHGRLVIFPKLEIFSKLMGAEEGDGGWRWTLSSWYSTGNVQIPENDLWGLQAHGPLDGLRKKISCLSWDTVPAGSPWIQWTLGTEVHEPFRGNL